MNKCWEKVYGNADYFHMQEVTFGIFKYKSELKNKDYHKISYFLQMDDDLVLECGMNVHKPNRRKKLDEKLEWQFEEFALSCRF